MLLDFINEIVRAFKKRAFLLFIFTVFFGYGVNTVSAVTIDSNFNFSIDDTANNKVIIYNATTFAQLRVINENELVGEGIQTISDLENFYNDNYNNNAIFLEVVGTSCRVSFVYPYAGCLAVAVSSATLPPPPPPPPPPPAPAPLSFALLPTTTQPSDLTASVIDGVQATGVGIWPLFAFLGVQIAFIIALQLVVFTRRSIMLKNANRD